MSLDIRKLSLFLSGKLPPEYTHYSRLHFFELLEEKFDIDTVKADFYRNQANKYEEEFYKLIFEYLWSKYWSDETERQRVIDFVSELWFEKENNYLSNREELKTKREALKVETNSQTKGRLLEEFLVDLFDQIEWLNVVANNLNNWDEEIDIVLQNNSKDSFLSSICSPLILLEAKNWKDSVPTKFSRDFSMKVHYHKNLSRVWILVSVNWVTWETDEFFKRIWSTDELLVIITWNGIDLLLSDKIDPIERLKSLFVNSLK